MRMGFWLFALTGGCNCKVNANALLETRTAQSARFPFTKKTHRVRSALHTRSKRERAHRTSHIACDIIVKRAHQHICAWCMCCGALDERSSSPRPTIAWEWNALVCELEWNGGVVAVALRGGDWGIHPRHVCARVRARVVMSWARRTSDEMPCGGTCTKHSAGTVNVSVCAAEELCCPYICGWRRDGIAVRAREKPWMTHCICRATFGGATKCSRRPCRSS